MLLIRFSHERKGSHSRGRSRGFGAYCLFLAAIASFLGTFSSGEHYCLGLGGVYDFLLPDRRFMK